tara:strand:+ start:145 stop:408 length:264 start_codon:yes stop_codon:yes gene_type:complete
MMKKKMYQKGGKVGMKKKMYKKGGPVQKMQGGGAAGMPMTMEQYSADLVGGVMKSKGMAKGGKVKSKGMAKGGKVKPKGMKKGGKVK